ncbi:cell division protein ZapA [Legionella sp. PC997]|nr:cell division protein ZapA [Legionella sp. PC997]
MELQRSYIMTQMKSCTVKLLNKTYEIKCPEGEEPNLLLAVQKLNNQIGINKKKAKQLDEFQILLLAALDISHELILCKNKQAHQQHQVTQFINSLENKINKMVGGEMVERLSELD